MNGRNGYDLLARDVSFLALIFVILSLFGSLRFFVIPALILYAYSWFRMFSKNTSARTKENNWYAGKVFAIKNRFKILSLRWKDRKTHRYFKCPKCKSYMRIKKSDKKGIKIMVTCSKCGNEFKAVL